LVSFGNIWRYLTLTGTIWAQSNYGIKGIKYLTTKPALVNRIVFVDIDWRFNMLGCCWGRQTIHHFRFIRFEKATSNLLSLL